MLFKKGCAGRNGQWLTGILTSAIVVLALLLCMFGFGLCRHVAKW
jgi:hypothetical protein